MLGVTVADMISQSYEQQAGAGATDLTMATVLQRLSQLGTVAATDFRRALTAGGTLGHDDVDDVVQTIVW
jgi:hypothetical protein